MDADERKERTMRITDFNEFKKISYQGKRYAVILHDEKNLLVIDTNEQADSNGFFACAWLIYEGRRIFGIVKADDYVIRFNPVKKEIRMDELKAAS